MKSVTCDLCDICFEAETFEVWLDQMKLHYTQMHADLMKASANLSTEEQMKKIYEWMETARQKFNAANE